MKKEVADLATTTFEPAASDVIDSMFSDMDEMSARLEKIGRLRTEDETIESLGFAQSHCRDAYERATEAVLRSSKSLGVRSYAEFAADASALVAALADPICKKIEGIPFLNAVPNRENAQRGLKNTVAKAIEHGRLSAKRDIDQYAADLQNAKQTQISSNMEKAAWVLFGVVVAKSNDIFSWIWNALHPATHP